MWFDLWFSKHFSRFSYIAFTSTKTVVWLGAYTWRLNGLPTHLGHTYFFVDFSFSWKQGKAITNMDKKRRLLQNICICQENYMQHQMRKNRGHVCLSTEKIICEEKDCVPPLSSTVWYKSSSFEGKYLMETFYSPQIFLGHMQGVKARGCQSSGWAAPVKEGWEWRQK